MKRYAALLLLLLAGCSGLIPDRPIVKRKVIRIKQSTATERQQVLGVFTRMYDLGYSQCLLDYRIDPNERRYYGEEKSKQKKAGETESGKDHAG